MAYYCFLCNENHDDDDWTREHFIPKSIEAPNEQWLPVCKAKNALANSTSDNWTRDIFYLKRFESTKYFKRFGEALLEDGSIRKVKFSYKEDQEIGNATFDYIYDIETDLHIPGQQVYAIKIPVGLIQNERIAFCRGLVKMSLGTIAYCLQGQDVEVQTIKQIFSQISVDTSRRFALGLPLSEKALEMMIFLLNQSDVVKRLQNSCKNTQVKNHVVNVIFQKDGTIHVEGMLYSQYGWTLKFENKILIDQKEPIRLENSINCLDFSDFSKDLTLSSDAIVVISPDFTGQKPIIPPHWKNST
ncbi:MAG: hypothetical protein KAH96_01185 [Alphaproteobacteria bacterium]|nr:hypothetical protein [Alphaproteobacteria bacterium]